ncbi:MAG: acyloxyacyl hydrolase [Candidatus Omnitrophica bacterium]|nr:acyloxyacyl hydrolase [Candidatus Omnitrophota bacterium]
MRQRNNLIGNKLLSIVFLAVIYLFGCLQQKTFSLPDEFQWFSGGARGRLHGKGHYVFWPIYFCISYNVDKFWQKIKLSWFERRAVVDVEPFIAIVTRPNSNIETGCSLFIKLFLLSPDKKIAPYVRLGSGLVYMSQHTREQATQFNFIDTLGLGIKIGKIKDSAVSLEYRFRHLSNCSIKKPNEGIDSHLVLLGVSRKF